MKQSNVALPVIDRKSSSNYLENIKNMTMVKFKIKESLDIFPKDHNILLNTNPNLKSSYFTEKKNDRKNNLEDLDEFIKSEKKNIKKAKRKTNLFEDKLSSLVDGKENVNMEPQTGFKQFYKLYIQELEQNIDELLNKNEELENKFKSINDNNCDNEIRLQEKTIECLKYKKFKKITGLFKNERKDYFKNLNQEENIKNSNNNDDYCDNPICLSNALSLVELSKEHDKVLIENIKLRRENKELKNIKKKF